MTMSRSIVPVEVRLTAVLYSEAHSLKNTAKKFNCHVNSVSKWIKMYKETGSVADPPACSGRKRKLEERDEEQVVKLARTHVGITNVSLAKASKMKITPRTVSNILTRSDTTFATKLIQYDYPETFTQEHFLTGKKFMNFVKRIPMQHRIYVDETWLGPNVRKKRMRVPKDIVPQLPAPTGQKLTVISAIRESGSLNITTFFESGSITTEQFVKWVKLKLAPHVRPGDSILWDQLGKYGKEREPYRLHWSLEAKQQIEARGGTVAILPPKGKLFNPIELFFRDVKGKYISKLPAPKAIALPQKITPRQMKLYWNRAEKDIHPSRFKHYFQERANGREFQKVCKVRGLC